MDVLSIIGVVVGLTAVLAGQHLEGGHLQGLINGPALLIVLGGSLGAVLLQSPMNTFIRAIQMSRWILVSPHLELNEAIEKLIKWSHMSRKEGLLGLEVVAKQEDDLFVRKGIQLLVDGNEPEVIRDALEIELQVIEDNDIQAAKVYESMGGYTPTLGILGAVMGLIHVMENLAEPEKLGGGIAVAFVATVYGVAFANMLFLPASKKLKALIRNHSRYRELLIEGITAIAEGENPRSLEGRLSGFLQQ